jgi:oxazoline/thiazoline synthase
VGAIGADLTLAMDDVTVRPLAGRLFPLLLPLIDGRRTRFDIADALDGRATLLDVDFGLQELAYEGIVYDRAAPALAEVPQPSPEQAAPAPPEPLSAAVVVTGGMDVAIVDAFMMGAQDRGIRIVRQDGDGDVRIVLTTDYFGDHLRDLSRDAFSSSIPWMIVKPIGAAPWIGPLFDRRRKTPCWNCLLLRLRETFRLEEYLRVHAPDVRLPNVEPLTSARAARASGQIAADLGRRCLSAEPSARSAAALIAMDLETAAVSEHRVSRRPDCVVCGRDRTEAEDLVSTALVLDDRGQRLSADLLGHVSPITGIVGSIESATSPGAPAYVAVADHIFGPEIDNRDSIWRGFRRSTSGAGASDAEARRSAICEALERYSGVFRPGDSSRRATYGEIGETALHPNEVMGFSEAQFADRQAWNDRYSHPALRIPEPFDEHLACDWTAVRHITSPGLAWLPTALCYFGTPDPRARHACRAESNGCAAGATRDDALVRGFLELVERDAVGLWWHNRIPRSGIALDTITDGYVRAVVDLYARLGRSLWILDIQSDLGIPVFAALSVRAGTDDEQLTVGFGASFDPSAALRHAVTELNLFLPEVMAGRRRALVCGPEPSGDYLHPASLLPWNAGERDSSRPFDGESGSGVERITRVARRHGLRVFALDQTRADVGLPTVRVVIPGLCHFWRRLAPKRLYSVPVGMGWLSAPQREDELNPSCLLV